MKKNIHLISTGGTISSSENTSGLVTTGNYTVADLIEKITPDSSKLKLTYSEPYNIDSSQLSYKNLNLLLQHILEVLNKLKPEAIILTHGTDTLEETAMFLYLQLKIDIPLIITGSQYSIDHTDSDALTNLQFALELATNNLPVSGIFTVFNNKILGSFGLQKIDTELKDAFYSPLTFNRNEINYDNLAALNKLNPNNTHLKLPILVNKINFVPSVKIFYPGYNQAELTNVLKTKPQALIIVGTGSGNIPAWCARALADYQKTEKNTFIAITSRVPLGKVEAKYAGAGGGKELQDAGYFISQSLRPAQLRIALLTLISSGLKNKQITQLLTEITAVNL